MDFRELLRDGLIFGLALSFVLGAVSFAALRVNPEIMFNDYPPDVRAKYGAMSRRAKRQRLVAGLASLAALVGLLTLSFARLEGKTGGLTFGAAFTNLLVIFTVFNLVDLLVIDWLICVRLQPKFIVLPGTEGLAGYRDYRFHFRGFLIGMVVSFVASALVAGSVVLLRRVT